jgi:hypothetical protein
MALVHGAQEPLGVRDGLVLYFDAANARSYPRTGSTWFDRSGNNNHGTLNGGVQYSGANGGCLIFNGTDGYVQFTNTVLNAQTVCFWGRKDADMAHLGAFVARELNADGGLRSTGEPNFGGTFWGEGTSNADDFHNTYGSSLMINGVSNLSEQGVFGGTSIISPGSTTLYDDFYVGAIGPGMDLSFISHNFFGRTYKGRVYAVSLYNRRLTNAELLQNYNALKGRYGLS